MSQERIIDITPPLVAGRTKTWPGDTPFTREVLMDTAKGSHMTLSAVRSTVHLGAHADGAIHYAPPPAKGVGEMGLEHFLGPCQVVAAKVERGGRVTADDLEGGIELVTAPRVLIRTGTFDGFDVFNEDFAGLSPELVGELADKGVITVGIDTPSVDLIDSKDMPAHKAIYERGIAILEGLDLAGAEAGGTEYELIALPLKLMGWDGSPVRAVLRGRD